MISHTKAASFLVIMVFAIAACVGNRAGVMIEDIGSFYVGGEAVHLRGLPTRKAISRTGVASNEVDPNGDYEVGQMYVQYIKLANPKERFPIVFWHGGSLTGVSFESKPDGTKGWQMRFVETGYDTYIVDSVERGRATWARYPEIYAEEPVFRDKKEIWELFRIGPKGSYATLRELRRPFEGTQFPVESFDIFMKQVTPRFTVNDEESQSAYDELIDKICPCILVTHSASGPFGFRSALNNPGKIVALVSVEPSGGISINAAEAATLASIPHLLLWGDFLNDDAEGIWGDIYQSAFDYASHLRDFGGSVEWVDLPRIGIHGNSHMIMMDGNSDRIARMIEVWLKNVLAPGGS